MNFWWTQWLNIFDLLDLGKEAHTLSPEIVIAPFVRLQIMGINAKPSLNLSFARLLQKRRCGSWRAAYTLDKRVASPLATDRPLRDTRL
jgi:hypothetical protein